MRAGRDVTFALAVAVGALWLTFFAGPGTVEMATLAAALVALVWFATTDPARLVDERRRPHPLLFGLTAMAAAVLVTASAVLGSGTVLVTLGIGTAAIVTGVTRAVRHGMRARTDRE